MNATEIAAVLTMVPTTIACGILMDQALAERTAQGLSTMSPACRFVGPVRIIEFLPGRAELRWPDPPANFAVVDAVNPGEVLALGAGGSAAGAVMGDMLATQALQRGTVGAVVDGAARDLDWLAHSDLPVQACGVATMAAHATLIPSACGHAIRFAGFTVMPGDRVPADRDGILFLTPALVGRLLARRGQAIAKDEFSCRLLLQGQALTEAIPLPPSLAPLMAAFRSTGKMPTSAQVREASSHE